jgi:hypothetical protein
MPVESLQSHMILTMSHWSSGLTYLLPATRVTGSNPLGGLMWNRDSPVSVVSLQWWPRSGCTLCIVHCSVVPLVSLASTVVTQMWLIINRASSPTTVTRPSCRQCDSPTWSHTAFLSRFHACCRSPFWLHNRRSRLLEGSPVESLQSHMILTMSHWSNGLTCLLPATRVTGSNSLRGLMWNWDSPVSVVSLQWWPQSGCILCIVHCAVVPLVSLASTCLHILPTITCLAWLS